MSTPTDIHLNLYLVRMRSKDGAEDFYKLGVTKHAGIDRRFSYGSTKVADSGLPLDQILKKLFAGERYISDHPYHVEVLHSVRYEIAGYALIAERDALDAIAAKRYWPKLSFPGQSECFKGVELQDIIDFMDAHSAEANASAPEELTYRVHFAFCKERDPIKRHLKTLEAIKQRESDNE